VIQRALGGFPVGCNCGEQVILAWLMTLPDDIDRVQAARSLLSARAAGVLHDDGLGGTGSARAAPVHNCLP